jgi:uncharacterized protein (TIGR04255 family)
MLQKQLHQKLPDRLGKEPLIDAVFELRFDCAISAAEIMPGFLHAKLGGDVTIERLPVAQLPIEIRQNDPNLAGQPLVRITWANHLILVGDRSLAVGCLLPYPGWTKFREVILQIMNLLKESGIVRTLQRYSLKYVDMLSVQAGDSVSEWINLNVALGNVALSNQPFQMHMQIESGGYIHALLVGSPAQAQGVDGITREGMVISVDTMFLNGLPDFPTLIEQLRERVDDLHSSNKQVFFDCLTANAVEKLEPEYGTSVLN